MLDDCVQEVAVIAWKKGPMDEGDSAFLGHVLATARLIGLAAIRKKQDSRLQALSPEVAVALAEKVAAQEEAEQDSANQRLAALRQCLGKLEPEPRALLEARYFSEGGERVKAEAQRLGKSLDALYKKLERLRDLLRACVSAQLKTLE
jgi:DNA-directed RNA polymerase specialized sigma24 family protein